MTQAEKSRRPTTFLISEDGGFRAIEVAYFGGPRYPHLVRIKDRPDLLGSIMAPHAGS